MAISSQQVWMMLMVEKINNVQIQERMISLGLGKPVKSEASDMAQ